MPQLIQSITPSSKIKKNSQENLDPVDPCTELNKTNKSSNSNTSYPSRPSIKSPRYTIKAQKTQLLKNGDFIWSKNTIEAKEFMQDVPEVKSE